MLHGRFGTLDQRHAILPRDTLIAITLAVALGARRRGKKQ